MDMFQLVQLFNQLITFISNHSYTKTLTTFGGSGHKVLNKKISLLFPTTESQECLQDDCNLLHNLVNSILVECFVKLEILIL
jgi:hypothetical protein